MDRAIVFPGQGTQAPGMAASWRDHPAWAVVERAEKALGEPLADLVIDAPAEQLARTREAQLAVLLTSLVVWEASHDALGAPAAFAGHSLGQVTALIAAGVIPLDDGVRFAARRAELTQAAADKHSGRMVALLGATPEQAADACSAAPDECWVANDNAPGQVVIAGTPAGVEAGAARAKEIGVRRATPLNVGGAFHTPLMQDATDELAKELRDVELRDTAVPVVSNDDAHAYTDGAGWRARLAAHVSVPVRWREVQLTLADRGAAQLVEVGHGSMLAALAKRTVPDLTVVNIATPTDLDALNDERARTEED
ncbi:MAG: ACP S-malonyltransferase [Actinobacteria bacterium]|nr:ACP S-malonyltransferase [Actinomycetota bacterium]